ncbi:MAG: NifB/NifX family molybdenum-iron cluster-binding protein [Actinobacteria bacterium]|nr:NifB/NifX family molybdenum-iron cluster-binding protein [Actinomycetota bacterium]
MKIAIATDGNYVSSHFGRCPLFTIVEIQNNKEISREVIKNPGHHPGYLPQYLAKIGVDYVVAGGMGPRAVDLFRQLNIEPILGIDGMVESVVEKLVKGTLEGGDSTCKPGFGRGYGIDKTECDHGEEN